MPVQGICRWLRNWIFNLDIIYEIFHLRMKVLILNFVGFCFSKPLFYWCLPPHFLLVFLQLLAPFSKFVSFSSWCLIKTDDPRDVSLSYPPCVPPSPLLVSLPHPWLQQPLYFDIFQMPVSNQTLPSWDTDSFVLKNISTWILFQNATFRIQRKDL